MKLLSMLALFTFVLSGCALYSGMENEANSEKTNGANGTTISVPSSQNPANAAHSTQNNATSTAAKMISPVVH